MGQENGPVRDARQKVQADRSCWQDEGRDGKWRPVRPAQEQRPHPHSGHGKRANGLAGPRVAFPGLGYSRTESGLCRAPAFQLGVQVESYEHHSHSS